MQSEVVEIEVGGVPYSLSRCDMQKYPGCFLECIIKKEWSAGKGKITIDRDGQLFKYVYAFLVCGSLPRDKNGMLILDVDTLAALKVEADFYNLEELSRECEIPLKTSPLVNIASYMTMRKYINHVKGRHAGSIEVEFPTKSSTTKLLQALGEVWNQFCITGSIEYGIRYNNWSKPRKLFMSSTLCELNVPELLQHATQSPFGHGTETVTDTSVRNSFEIDASLLDNESFEYVQQCVHLKNFTYNQEIDLRPYKLVIYKEGGHFDAHRDTVRGDGHIGTLVVILNSEYTGGELEVTHGGRTEVVTGPYSWVAMYGDCLHKINPVTSGTRVSLIFDLYIRKFIPLTVASKTYARSTELVSAPTVAVTSNEITVNETVAAQNNSSPASSSSSEHSSAVYSTQDEQEEPQEEPPEELNSLIDFDGEVPADSFHDYEFWNRNYYDLDPMADQRARGADAALQARILHALDSELLQYDTVILCLQHLYPECQAHPASLKGGDRVLYDILTDTTTTNTNNCIDPVASTSTSSDTYDVQVVAATIYHSHDPGFSEGNILQGKLFSPIIVQQELSPAADKPTNTSHNSSVTAETTTAADEPAIKKQRVSQRTKLILPNAMNSDNFLDYSPYEAYTGNESQAEETVYIVAGLQVRRNLF